jgi:menaquinone-9 beta-reductase
VNRYDIVVVGAGPAGSAAAISLAERGRRVVLVDKATFPRDKVCGDFLSPRSLAVLDALGCLDAVQAVHPHRIRRSTVYLGGQPISAGPLPQMGELPGYGLVVPRADLDEILVRRAAAAGAEVVEGVEAVGLTRDAGGVTVSTHGSALHGRLAVLADGAHSRLTRAIGLTASSGKTDPFALRAYFTGVRCDPDTTAVFFEADYFPGYAWLFPTGGGRANVGMGIVMDVSRRYGINLRDRFVRWLEHDRGLRALLDGARPDGKIVGWPLPTYQGEARTNYADRVLVVGDAGRFVDPINGEGIHTALESARIASSVADSALSAGDLSAGGLSAYERRWRLALELDLRTSDLMTTVAKNRVLLPLWMLTIRAVAARSMVDPDFAARSGGIMAGVVPAHEGVSPELAFRSMVQDPRFWLRHRGEVGAALAALWGAAAADPAWAASVMSKMLSVSTGLARSYGVPWAAGTRPGTDPFTRMLDLHVSAYSALARSGLAVVDGLIAASQRRRVPPPRRSR